MERFSGFYTSRPFWAGSKIEFPYNTWTDPRTFYDLMSELTYEKRTDELTLRVYKDGQILLRIQTLEDLEQKYNDENRLDITEKVARAKIYINYLNCFYLLLESATITIDRRTHFNFREITTHDIFRILFKDGKHAGNGVPTESITSHFLNGRHLSDYNAPHSLELDSRISYREEISLKAIDYATTQLLNVYSKNGSINHFASIAKSIAEYKIGNYDTSIVLAWFVIESIVNSLWLDHINSLNFKVSDNKLRISRARRDELTHSSFDASKTTQILELFGVLSLEIYEKITRVRKDRNKIVHISEIDLTAEKAGNAISAAKDMILLKWGIDFTPNLNYSISG